MAAGWLGWLPETILTTPIPQVLLAIEGKVDFLKKTNPWGSSEEDEAAKRLAEAPSNPEQAQKDFLAIVRRRQRAANRQGRQKKR